MNPADPADAKAKRTAALAKALQDYTLALSLARGSYDAKELARNPAPGVQYKRAQDRATEDYHKARSLAQGEYLAATTPTPAIALAADYDVGLYDDAEAPPPKEAAPPKRPMVDLSRMSEADLDRFIAAQINGELAGFDDNLGQNYIAIPKHTDAELDAAYARQRKGSDPASGFKYRPLT